MIAAIDDDGLLDILKHPNAKKYPHQKLYVVAVNGYVYLIPFVEKEKGVVFLKTIIPSRKAKKMYLSEEEDDV
ncbi:MAG: toxin [Gammaproteobacteria bacterium]